MIQRARKSVTYRTMQQDEDSRRNYRRHKQNKATQYKTNEIVKEEASLEHRVLAVRNEELEKERERR